jgi:hypothetical protein
MLGHHSSLLRILLVGLGGRLHILRVLSKTAIRLATLTIISLLVDTPSREVTGATVLGRFHKRCVIL